MSAANEDETVWEPRRLLVISSLITASLFIFGLGIYQKSQAPKYYINGHRFIAELAETDAQREQGLSGRKSLGSDKAMVFLMDQDRQHCFWMKDMNFNIDIVWVDETDKITAIETNVAPNSYPKQFCHNGKTVVELRANAVAKYSIKVGDTAKF